ncbi:hypothetical protein JCM8097_007999 [Rhodosporidiobolus ruineniae]
MLLFEQRLTDISATGEVPLQGGTGPLASGSWTVNFVASDGLLFPTVTVSLEWAGVHTHLMYATGRIAVLKETPKGHVVAWSRSFEGSAPFPGSTYGTLRSSAFLCCQPQPVKVVVELVEHSSKTSTAAAVFAASTTSPHRDVLLVFPRCQRQIWTSSALLRVSPYFETLFSSAYSEAEPKQYVPRASTSAEKFVDDSDDEFDTCLPSMPLPSFASPTSQLFRTVTIDQASYTTYLAVVCWMQTRHITFAPLFTSFLGEEDANDPLTARGEALQSRSDAVSSLIADQTSLLPSPASPKSVYRLADFLELPDLRSLSLLNLHQQLTPQNAARELFSDTANLYHAVRDLVLDYIVKRKDEVFQSRAMREMMAKGEAGELPQLAMGTWVTLLRRVAEA